MKFWKILQKLPTPVRYFFVRRIFTFDYELPEHLTFKIADTAEEMEQAFRIIHDGFVERNLMDENEHKLRINKYFALPTTSVIVCKFKDEVIATASVIQDSSFRLPTDEFRDLDQFRKKGQKLVEVSGLAIKHSWRKQKGKLMIPLSKYMWEYSHYCLKADAIVISTAAFAKDFYRGLFLFEPLDEDKVVSFGTVKNSKTVSQILFMKPFLGRLEETFRNVPAERSLWALSKHVYPEFQYPARPYNFTSDPVLSPEDIRYFFKEKSHVLASMSESEKRNLAVLYHFDEFRNVILDEKQDSSGIKRHSLRSPVACDAHAFASGTDKAFDGEVREVSRGGLKLVSDHNDLEVGQEFRIDVRLNDSKTVSLKTVLRWKRGLECGLELTESVLGWLDFVSALEERHPSLRENKIRTAA